MGGDFDDLEKKPLKKLKEIAAKYGVTHWDLVGRADHREPWIRILNDIKTNQEFFKKWSDKNDPL